LYDVISYDGKTELVFVPGVGRGGGLSSDRYISDILLEHVIPYAGYIDDNFVLMHDNARYHTCGATTEFLDEVGIATVDWPSLSPNLNPIEHLWDELKRRVRLINPGLSSVEDLTSALIEEWEHIPQESVKKLIRSMTNRLRAIIRARGGNTKY
jgi:transposase